MLTISKPLSAGQAQSYHQKEFTAKEQNYWSQRGVIAGEWQGRVATKLGLTGDGSEEALSRLGQGHHATNREQPRGHSATYQNAAPGGEKVQTVEHRAC